MEKDIKRRLQMDLMQEAEDIMKEVNADESLKDVKAPEELHDRIFAEIHAMEQEKQQANRSAEELELIELGRVYKRRRKWRKYWVLAAAMVAALGLGITSMGGAEKIFEKVDSDLLGKERTNVDSKERVEQGNGVTEVEAYAKIEETFGITPVQFKYFPDGMRFKDYTMDEITQSIQIDYENKKTDQVILYQIRPNYRDSSIGKNTEDVLLEEEQLVIDDAVVNIQKFKVQENGEERIQVEFEYQDSSYFLRIFNLPWNEVENIVKNLYFL